MNPPNQDMNRFDELLKTVLQRTEPPLGFAERVLARVEHPAMVTPKEERLPWFHIFNAPFIRWAALATVSALLIVGTVDYRNVRRERAEGEAAKKQLMLALHIAGSKLQLAKSKVVEIQISRPNGEAEKNKSRSKS
jgi:hypothetical protein